MAVILCFSLFTLAGLAPGGQERSRPVVRVSTRLVQVNAVVQDKAGNPIPDLARDDFVLTDNGREQSISFFGLQSNQVGEVARKATPLPPHTFSNRFDRATTPSSVTVILLDGLNTHFEDQTYAKAQVLKFLGQIRPQDQIAIYTLGLNLKVLHDFTNNTQSLLAALAHYVGKEAPHVSASEPAPEPTSITVIVPGGGGNTGPATIQASPVEVGLDDYLRQTAQQSADFYSMDRTLRTLSAVQTIANRLAQIPGRKSLVWVSASFPFTIGSGTANTLNVTRGQRSFGPEIERTEQALNHANLAIYPVDARGLIGPYGADLNMSATRSVTARSPTTPTIEGLGEITPTHDTMDELAGRTGGRAFYGSNDILGAIRRALEDSSMTYALGYYPSNTVWDGSFHEIKVKVKRAGVRVLCRRGYFALAEKPLDAPQRESALNEEAMSPLDATGIELTVRAEKDRSPGILDLTVNMDAHNLALDQKGDRWVGSVDVLFAQLSAAGQVVSGLLQPISLNLTQDEYRDIVKRGISFSGRLQLTKGAERLRIVGRDRPSGAFGSLSIPLDPGVR